MARLPYSRVVNVTMTRNQQFPSRRGFGVPLFLTTQNMASILGSNLTKTYGSMEEVAADFDAGDEFYDAALQAFGQNPRPLQIKVGQLTGGTGYDADALADDLDAIYDADNEWYWISIEAALRDDAALDGLIAWTEAKPKLAMIDSNDAGHESQANTTCISARHKGTVERTAVFYHTDVTLYPAFALAAKLGTFNFDNAGSAYTGKFKNLAGISALNKGSAVVQAITGFTPAIGQATSTGHLANTHIDIGGQIFTAEGSVLKPNVFIDEIHATDWIIARTEELALATLLNNARVPFTDAGMEMLAAAPRTVMQIANQAGLIANDLNPETGEYEPAVVYEIPSVFSVPEAQRKARIAPAIKVTFRYAGAVHYTTVNFFMVF
jgi:hypothetical protein